MRSILRTVVAFANTAGGILVIGISLAPYIIWRLFARNQLRKEGRSSPAQPKPLLFENISDDDLLSYGVPGEWLDDVHGVNEDTVLDLAEHLPDEAAEALLNLAVGVKPQAVTHPSFEPTNSFDHPDAQRRFRVMNNVDELERALNYPWEKWSIFLHPEQRKLVEKDYNGPARVSGSVGTGRTL